MNFLLSLIVVILFLIWLDLPARKFQEQAITRIVHALESIAETLKNKAQ